MSADVKKIPVKFNSNNRFELAQFKFNRWSLALDEHETLDDVLRPEAWAHLAAKIIGHDEHAPKGRGDIIEVRKIDAGVYAEFLVIEAGPGYVRLREVARSEGPAVRIESDVYATKWNVGRKTHDVIRASDGVTIKDGFQSKDAAAAWIAEQVAKTRAA